MKTFSSACFILNFYYLRCLSLSDQMLLGHGSVCFMLQIIQIMQYSTCEFLKYLSHIKRNCDFHFVFEARMKIKYHRQQNKCYSKGVYLPISKLHSILAVANLLARNNKGQICYCGQISLQSAAVFLTI